MDLRAFVPQLLTKVIHLVHPSSADKHTARTQDGARANSLLVLWVFLSSSYSSIGSTGCMGRALRNEVVGWASYMLLAGWDSERNE